jgi:hypothetical protein
MMKTFFKQSCPVCGRPLYVPVELWGGEASCSHCTGVFIADGQDANERHASCELRCNCEPPTSDCGYRNGLRLAECGCFTCRADLLSEIEHS